MSDLTAAEVAAHVQVCETSVDDCAEYNGPCVRAVAAARLHIAAEIAEEVTELMGTAPDASSALLRLGGWLARRSENRRGGSDAG